VLPGSFGGPGFSKNTPTIDILEALMLNAFRMGCPDADLPYADVRDVLAAGAVTSGCVRGQRRRVRCRTASDRSSSATVSATASLPHIVSGFLRRSRR
jgi:hypothetical protein